MRPVKLIRRWPAHVIAPAQLPGAAPAEPPCFGSRRTWVEYLGACQDDKQASRTSKPFVDGEFNPSFNYCADCRASRRREMSEQGLCDPEFVRSGMEASVA